MMVAVMSIKGSPGVTTLCLALAARWPAPGRAVVVEADPAGGDIAVRFGLAQAPGLLSLAAAARRETDAALVWRHAQALPGDLPVVAAPPDATRARAALAALAPLSGAGPLRIAADHPGAVVVVDCGRVDTGSPALPALRAADVTVVLTRSGADDLAHLARRMAEIGGWSRRPVLLLAGRGHSIGVVSRGLGVTPLGRVPDDPSGAGVLRGGTGKLRWHRHGPGRSLLGQAAHEVATFLDASRAEHAADRGTAAPLAAPSAPGRPEARAVHPATEGAAS